MVVAWLLVIAFECELPPPGRVRLSSSESPCWRYSINSSRRGLAYLFLEARGREDVVGIDRLEVRALPYWARWAETPTIEQMRGETTITQTGSGWPFIAFSSYLHYDHGDARTADLDCALRIARGGRAPLFLPICPIWQGVLLDTALYSCVWTLLVTAVLWARKAIRAARGVCPRCCYDLRGNSAKTCPECGLGEAE